MKQQPLPISIPAVSVTLSKALENHRGAKATYAKYAPVKRVACDECVNVLHENKGQGQPPLGARQTRRSDVGTLRICEPHAKLWRELDGVGKSRRTRDR